MRRPKDSGSSGNDRDRSSGSRRSESRKSDRIVRKPSKELLKIQNFSDSSEDENRLSSNKESLLKRTTLNKVPDSKSFHEQLSSFERKDDLLVGEGGGSSRTDQGSSLSPTGSRKSPSIGRQSPKRASSKTRKSPENKRKASTAPTQAVSKSLNNQIKDFIKSPPKNRRIPEASNKFDAFNHTSSHKLSHAHPKELDKPPVTMASLASYPVHYNESFDEFEYSYHPRRSSKEVLDFTSSRKALKEKTSKSEEKESVERTKGFKEDKGHKSDGSEGHHRRIDPDFLQCQCLSPRKETATEDTSPSHGSREKKEVFDFTSSKKMNPPLKTRKQSSREQKVDVTRNDVEVNSSGSSMKSPSRRKEDRNVFDFGVRNESGMESEYATLRRKGKERGDVDAGEYATLRRKGKKSSGSSSKGTEGEYATLRRKKSSRREVLDFTSGSSREVLDFTSSGDRREVLDFTSNGRLGNGSANTSQEILNLKSSSEFLGSKCNSREVLNQEGNGAAGLTLIEPWQETCLGGSVDAQEGRLSCSASKENLNREVLSPQPPRETIDPPDLFNTNKIFRPNSSSGSVGESKKDVVHFEATSGEEKFCTDPELSLTGGSGNAAPTHIGKPSRTSAEESTPITSAQRRKNYKTQTERSKRLRNRSLEMVLDETSGNESHQEAKSR